MLAAATSPALSLTGPALAAARLALWAAPVATTVTSSVSPRSASVGV